MRSLEERFADNIERSRQVDPRTSEQVIREIREELDGLNYELRHTIMEPSHRQELIKLSGAAEAVYARQVHAARNPLVVDPAPRAPHPGSARQSGNALNDALQRRRDRGMER